ncbi:ATP-binding protein [Aromatoleum buckelii]|uniref:AAA family ATPase n=1 Tax=Aromatoleum buckelii TaxID=200254 RepID=A0ABX1N503_9RHOO|nr:ATP-binding protein [Aromatoleum buckelii]MCK0509711.1 ATP-binding protein [Aromatoleum buckelii]
MIADSLAALAPELARLDTRIARAIERLRARYELSLDEFRGLYISDEQVDDLLRSVASHPDEPADAIAQQRAAAPLSPWSHVAAALALSDDERDLLLVCLAPELDGKYETLYAYLNNDVTRRLPTAELAARLLAADAAHAVALKGLLAPEAPLLACGAVEVVSGQHDLARARRGLRVAPALVGWLQGLPWIDERLSGVVRARDSDAVRAIELPAALAHVPRLLDDGMPLPLLVVTAPGAGDAALAAQAVFARAACPALVLDLAALAAAPSPADAVAAAGLMQKVLGVAIVASPLDALTDPDGRNVETVAAPLRRLAARSPTLMLAASEGSRWRPLLAETPALEIRLPEPDASARRRLWRSALGAHGDAAPVDALADRFVLGAERIHEAAATAAHAALLTGEPAASPRQLFAAARAASGDAGAGTTSTVSTPFAWGDLMVPSDVRARLHDLVSAIELRCRVLDDWGFAARLGAARGVKALFAGPSGTGKTMAAGIIARTLELELQRIELAQVTSKYIGETEKNLDRAFAAARRANAVLFIDEADALLGKRSEVKDAHDRYANIETAYLLQKMEDHDGIVILATNLAKNIDEAFSRRMQFVVEFPMPDAASREALWRRMIPPQAPLAADVDFAFLARQFALAGGDIRNIVLDAAYQAARAAGAIGMTDLLRAVARQNTKRGRVSTVAEFREYFSLLAETASADGRADRRPAGEPTR